MRRRTVARLAGLVAACATLLLARSAGAAEPPAVLKAKVTRVNDGDSIEVDTEQGHARVRMSAIDTPEYDQPYGAQSSAALKALLPVGSDVELEIVTQDQFKRMVAVVWRVAEPRINVNETMLPGPRLGLPAFYEGREILRPRTGSPLEEAGPVGAAGQRLGVSTRMALPQER